MERIWLSPPHMGPAERELLMEAFDSNWIAPLGPHVNGFEAEIAAYAGVDHAAALSSGTAALQLALLLLGVGPGDDVLTSSFTFAATANAVKYVGANPVFIDSDEYWNMDPQLLEDELASARAAGRRVGAVLAVDLYGQCPDYDALNQVCDRYDVPLVEDAAESLGSTYKGKKAGTLGCMGVYSFNGNKIITTSGGGMLISNRQDWIERARFLATQARDPAPHYQHSTVGYNFRLSNLLAAVGRGQLQVLDDRVAARQAIYDRYLAAFEGVDGLTMMPTPDWCKPNRWLSCFTVDEEQFGVDREVIRLRLEGQQIECRPLWKPMHQQPVFADCRSRVSGVSEGLFKVGLCLPSGSSLTEEQQQRIIGEVLAAR